MSFDSLLVNTCTIERYTEGMADAYGVLARTWADHITDEPCRISYPRGRQIQRGTEVVPVEALLFLNEVDVTEDDRVTVDTVLYQILFVADRVDGFGNHHNELLLNRTKP